MTQKSKLEMDAEEKFIRFSKSSREVLHAKAVEDKSERVLETELSKTWAFVINVMASLNGGEKR